jgi:hypothetical protein
VINFKKLKQGVVAHDCNPSTWEAEAVGSWVPGQPGLHSETLSQKQVLEVWLKQLSACFTSAKPQFQTQVSQKKKNKKTSKNPKNKNKQIKRNYLFCFSFWKALFIYLFTYSAGDQTRASHMLGNC